jgi:hypothetical protein
VVLSFAARAIPLYGADPYPNASVALDFVRGFYKAPGASGGSLSSLPGWSFSRTGVETDLATGATQFASGVPAIVPGLGLQAFDARTNSFAAPTVPATQSISIGATGTYVVSVIGSGSATSSAGSATGSGFGAASAGTPNVFTITATGTVTITVAGSPTYVNVQLGSFVTPMIPLGASTRGAVTAGATGLSAALTAPYTIMVDVDLPSLDGVNRQLLNVSDGTSSNRVRLYRDSSNNASVLSSAAAVNAFSTSLSGKTGARRLKFAARVRAGGLTPCADGTLATAIAVPGAVNQLRIGLSEDGFEAGNATFRRALILGDLSDAQLQALTT